MINLLQETIEILHNNGKTVNDVKWVGSNGRSATWNDFVKVANIDYDDGFGLEEIDMFLVVVGDNWWLERHEYDGSEWWEFKTLPQRRQDYIPELANILTESGIFEFECRMEKRDNNSGF